MKSKLHPREAEILLTLIFVSRNTSLFKLDILKKEWSLSQTTLLRYESPAYREISRIAARRAQALRSKEDRTMCQLCTHALKGHDRCTECTMLIHGEPKCACFKKSPYIALTNY